MVALGAICLIVAYSLGFIIPGGRGYGGAGYRQYSMNLLAPFDPGRFGSIMLPALVPQLERGEYEGYNYLGAGILVLAFIVLVYGLRHRDKLRRLDKRWLVPLFLSCLVLTLMALTTKVQIGPGTLVDVDPTPDAVTLPCAIAVEWPPVLASVLCDPDGLARCPLSVPAAVAGQCPAGMPSGLAVCGYDSASPMALCRSASGISEALEVSHLVPARLGLREPHRTSTPGNVVRTCLPAEPMAIAPSATLRPTRRCGPTATTPLAIPGWPWTIIATSRTTSLRTSLSRQTACMLSPLPSPPKLRRAQPARASVTIWMALSCVLQKRTSGLVQN